MQIRTQVYCFVLFLAVLLTSSLVRSQVGGSEETAAAPRPAADPGPFYAAVSQRFQVPTADVQEIVRQGLPPTQVVVACFLAQHSLRTPAEIAADRRSGTSWREIAMASGIGPELFYYPMPFAARQPFVNVHALFHAQPRGRWSWESLPLPDGDVEALVNLRFVTESTGQQAPQVVRLRSQGLDFVTIHNYLLSGQQTAQTVDGPRRTEVAEVVEATARS
jgi:hypothetical protein